MPIYEETYRSWHGQLVTAPRTWWVIAKTGVRLLWKKWMIILLMAAFGSLIGHGIYIYFVTRGLEQTGVGQMMSEFRINPGFFEGFIQRHWLLLIIVLLLAGAGIIANDRKFKALTIYFSKPVGFWDYTLGKFCVLCFYGCLVTLLPALLLFLFRVLLATDASYLKQYYWIPFSITGYSLLIILTLGSVLLAISASARGTRSAAILFFGLLYFPDLLRQILSRIPEVGLIALNADLQQAGSLLFELERPFRFSVVWAFVALLVVVILSFLLLRAKVKPTEVVR